MKITIKHKGQTKTGIIPEWKDLSVKQFIALETGVTELELISVLSGIDLTYIENTKTDLEPALIKIFKIYNNKPPELKKQKKLPIVIEGKEIKFPSTLDFTTFGQKSMTKNLIKENIRVETIISEVFAIYVQPFLDGKFISSKIPELKKEIEQMPIYEVYPYAVFFFKKLSELKKRLLIT